MNNEKRTHYIVSCKDCSLGCQCCHACNKLDLKKAQSKNLDKLHRGHHFKADTSITLKAAQELLVKQGFQDFELVGVRRHEFELVEPGLKRRAPLDEDFEEEVLTKQRRSSVRKVKKIVVSKGGSKSDPKLQAIYKRLSKLEESEGKTFLQLNQTHKQIIGLIDCQNSLFNGIQMVESTSQENYESLKSTTTQLKKDVKNLQNDYDGLSELISKQSIKFKEAFKSVDSKRQEQTRKSVNPKSNPAGSTSAPASVEKSKSKVPPSVGEIIFDLCGGDTK